ncbi:MAG TPA: HAMP domain-containing sensor histidine kinase, partial [Candidatus Nitrosocosmicus sp.]|nr:HAMP domain-containing sensor histidine kinase [Candidatus Nitrosocosmicus sp.]
MGLNGKDISDSNTDGVVSTQDKSTFKHKSAVIFEINETNYILESLIQNAVKLIDICGDPTWALKMLDSPEHRKSYQEFKERKGRIRVITDINANNISNCKVLMTFGEVRHIKELKGDFIINDSGECIAPMLSRGPESNLKFVYSNSVALQQQQQLIFNSIWNIAIPSEQKIREIEKRNFGSVITTIIDNPQNIIKRASMVTESSKWLSVCSTAEWIDSLNQEISKSFMYILEEKKKGKHQGIRWLCPINLKDIETIKFFSNEGIQFRHLDHIPVNFSVTDKYFNFTIEGLEDNNIEKNVTSQPKVLISNDKVHVNHFNVLFERLWKTGTDPYIRLRELEMVKSGQEEQKTELIRNSEEFDKRILQIIESTKHDVMLILGSSNALNQSLNNKAFEAFNSLVKEKSVRIRILLSTPLSSHSEIQLDKEQGQEEEEKEDVKYIRKIRNYIQNSMYRVQFDLIDNKHYNNEAEGMSVLVVDRTKVLCWESNKLLYENSKSTSLAIYSNSRPLVSSYSSIFESLWSGTQLYNDLKKAYAKISNSERLYKEFVDITAHELRTPIQAIMGYSEMALETRDEGPRINKSQYIRHFEKIFKNSYRLNRLLEDFLSVTRIENNLLVFEKENINIYDLVKNIVNDLQDVPTKTELDEEKKKNISIRLEEQHFEANPIVNVDKTKIYQVLTNLINNALKYSESNQGIIISMKIIANKVSSEKEGKGLFIDSNNSGEKEA